MSPPRNLFKVTNLAKLSAVSQCRIRSAELEGRGMAEAVGPGARTAGLLILVDAHTPASANSCPCCQCRGGIGDPEKPHHNLTDLRARKAGNLPMWRRPIQMTSIVTAKRRNIGLTTSSLRAR